MKINKHIRKGFDHMLSQPISLIFIIIFVLAGGYFITKSFAGVNAEPLKWAPPALINKVTISLGDGPSELNLDNTKDYEIVLPNYRKKGGIHIKGGHNVVIKGGYLYVPAGTAVEYQLRGIYIDNNAGTVHIEGIKIDNPDNIGFDGIAIASPQSIVQVENVRIMGLNGTEPGYHADVIQPWGGVKELRVDHLTASTNYQGLFLQNQTPSIGRADIYNTNLINTNLTAQGGGVLVWLTNSGNCDAVPITLSEVYVTPKTGVTLGGTVYPYSTSTFGCPAVISASSASWPAMPNIVGSVKLGQPINGDFVPDGNTGLNYLSPGYTPSPTSTLPGDVNSNGVVDITDLSILLTNWNKYYQPADFKVDSNNTIDIFDLSILLSNWTQS